jgi:hypothetical protein
MSSALTGNKIKDSYQALLKMGTNGSLDPITPIAISDGLGNDTPLLLSGIEFKTQVVSAAKFYGFWADLSANSHLALGDYAGQYNGTLLYVNDSARLIQTQGGVSKGFKLDFTNNLYLFGDYDNASNGTILSIDDNARTIITNNGSGSQGLFMDFVTDDYQFGDINGNTAYLSIGINGSSLFGNDVSSLESTNKQGIINNGINQLIYTTNDGTYSGDRGFKLNFANNRFQFGDFDTNGNGNFLTIDDIDEQIYTANQGQLKGLLFDFANMQYSFGDYNSINSGTSFYIDVANSTIYTQHSGQQEGLLFDFPTKNYFFGDFNGTNNGTTLQISDTSTVIQTNNGNEGLKLDFANKEYFFGDFNYINQNTYLQVNDSTQNITLHTQNGEVIFDYGSIIFNGPTQVGNTGDPNEFLNIVVNGTPYVIKLYNP